MMSTRFLDETLWAILWLVLALYTNGSNHDGPWHVLGREGAVVHKEELDVLGVADKEGLVAGRHHVAGLLVGAEADL